MGLKSIVRTSALAMGMGAMLASSMLAVASPAAAKKKKDDTSRRVCKVITPTGSRMTTRICRTQEEWDRSADKTAEGVLRHQTTETTTYEPAAGPR